MDEYLQDNKCMEQRTIAYTYLMMPHSVIGAIGIMSVQNKCVPAAQSCVATTPSRNVRVCSQRKHGNPPKSQDVNAWSLAITWPSLTSVDCTVRPTNDYTMGKAIVTDSSNRSCHSCTQYNLHMCWCVYLQLRKPTYGSVYPQICIYAPSIAHPACKAVSLQLSQVLTN